MTEVLDSLELAVDRIVARIPGTLHVATPLGLGKPHRLLNALYGRIQRDPARRLQVYTALSLDPPTAGGSDLQRRFLAPFLSRQFGDEFPRLDWVRAQRRDALPDNIVIEEFYLQGGALLRSGQAQRHYASLNYTHVARTLAMRGVNCIVQKVAVDAGGTRLSLSSNTDLTLDTIDALAAAGHPRPLLVAEIDPELPWLGGTAALDAGFFDIIVAPPAPYPKLFALPRQAVGDADHAIGLYASALVRDGGTLQLGIGALADAICHALALRHTDNAAYRRVLQALDPDIERHPAVQASGGLGRFEIGLYGCSEMVNEGFRRLVQCGVVRRRVVDKLPLQQRLDDGSASELDRELQARDGQFLHGGFYLGSAEFYDWLRTLDDDTRHGIGMRRISELNRLPLGDEALARVQRRDARFFNSCMMATVLGAAVSDGLADGEVVSGVGGQYDFVSMAHALPGARSTLLLRATRGTGGAAQSNLRWNYGHTTIPRHLRDIYISEYGIADVRGLVDEDCVVAMAAIGDARFSAGLLEEAKQHRKLRRDFAPPAAWAHNTPARLRDALAPFRRDGTLPDYPLGSDFTGVEQRLAKALGWLQANTSNRWRMMRTVAAALVTTGADDREALERMALSAPASSGERLSARLVAYALAQTRTA
jgi:acyl-CoA hydrolase